MMLRPGEEPTEGIEPWPEILRSRGIAEGRRQAGARCSPSQSAVSQEATHQLPAEYIPSIRVHGTLARAVLVCTQQVN